MKWFGQFLLASLLLVGCSGGEGDTPAKPKVDRNPPVKTITSFGLRGAVTLDVKTLVATQLKRNSTGLLEKVAIPDPDLKIGGTPWRELIKGKKGIVEFGSRAVSFPELGLKIGTDEHNLLYLEVDRMVNSSALQLNGEDISKVAESFSPDSENKWGASETEGKIKFTYFSYFNNRITRILGDPYFEIASTSNVAERDEIVVRHFFLVMNWLASSTRHDPFGSSNSRFNGHEFWDKDLWLHPAMIIADEFNANSIVLQRVQQNKAAAENFRKWQADGYPVANKKKHTPLPELVKIAGDVTPLMYPWESDADGREASPSDSVYEQHITGDVALLFHKAIILGQGNSAKLEQLIKGCAAFYLYRLDKNDDGSYGLHNVVSPDEWHTVDNDLYTNAIADWTIRRAFGERVWPHGKIKFPRRKETYATFENDTYVQYQQAAALLTLFPLESPELEKEAEAMYKFYRNKASTDGPAMSTAISSVVAARLGRRDDAYQDWLNSWQPYTQDPTAEFREKPVGGESYFVTGAAGSLNAVIYGFAGLRFHQTKPEGYECVIPLHSGGFLTVKPCVPAEWGSLTLATNLSGSRIAIRANQTNFNVQVDGKTVFNSKKPE